MNLKMKTLTWTTNPKPVGDREYVSLTPKTSEEEAETDSETASSETVSEEEKAETTEDGKDE